MRNVLIFLLGIVTGLWLNERQERKKLLEKMSRKSRTMEELSPTYRAFSQQYSKDLASDQDVLKTPEEHAERFSTILQEIDLASLTQHEIIIVKDKLEELVDLMWFDSDGLLNPNSLPSSYESGE